MLYRDDVVGFMWQERIVFMKKAILTSVTGAFSNQPAKFCRHIFAHPALASLPRTYPSLHHAHQKFSLLVLIQFVLQTHWGFQRSMRRQRKPLNPRTGG
jgi:hypothetical protein